MRYCKFLKLSSIIIVFMFALMEAQILTAASYDPLPSSSQQKATCRSVSGISLFLKKRNVLLFGEKHGTQEIPAFIADVVCLAAKERMRVTLGLEIPDEEQAAIDRFLSSQGGTADKAQLTKGAFWHPEMQDGRSSAAMLALIEQLRSLQKSGGKVRVVAYDSKPGTSSPERDRIMAQNLTAAITRNPKSLFIVLSGNIHARLTRGNQWNKEYESMGYLLTKSVENSRLFSFNASHEGGEAWVCIEESPDSKTVCKPLRMKPDVEVTAAWSVKPTAEPNAPYSGTFGIGHITASLPLHQ